MSGRTAIRHALASIEVVEDRSAESRCDEGFLRIARLRLRNHYTDGSTSEVYPCDVLSRPGSDAVVAVLYERVGEKRVRVVLRESPRAPIYLRRYKTFVHPDPRTYLSLQEVVAGLVEASDGPGDAGMRRRAAIETREEAGVDVAPEHFHAIGGETFASPGTGDEKIYFYAGAIDPAQAHAGGGDGSVMEEAARLVVLDLADAIEGCRDGSIPDMKTEVGLLRLADHLGYLPQLRCFVDELPPALRRRYARLGVAAASGASAEPDGA
ncbi:MAG: NUDIX hydrolase [Deltaproteobacteria bacterium]|nr:MAG: NUDIX hydrolase [Deltaproteobacteria bacterium]